MTTDPAVLKTIKDLLAKFKAQSEGKLPQDWGMCHSNLNAALRNHAASLLADAERLALAEAVVEAARKYADATNEMSWSEAGECHAKGIRKALAALDNQRTAASPTTPMSRSIAAQIEAGGMPKE